MHNSISYPIDKIKQILIKILRSNKFFLRSINISISSIIYDNYIIGLGVALRTHMLDESPTLILGVYFYCFIAVHYKP